MVEHKNYIIAAGMLIGVIIKRSDGTGDTNYFHQDRLGSLTLITNALGNGIAVTVIGGAASTLAGGKFENGAATAAYGYLFSGVINSIGGIGDTTDILVLGEVRHISDSSSTLNITVTGSHWLAPGAVSRTVFGSGEYTVIRTYGTGAGICRGSTKNLPLWVGRCEIK